MEMRETLAQLMGAALKGMKGNGRDDMRGGPLGSRRSGGPMRLNDGRRQRFGEIR